MLNFIRLVIAMIGFMPAHRNEMSYLGAPKVGAHEVRFVGGAKVDRPTYSYWPGDSRVVVFVHGGGWVSGSRDELPGWMVAFQDDGYTVASVDYTLGKSPQNVTDVTNAIAKVRSDLSPTKLVLAGWSAGSHLALKALENGATADALVIAGTPFKPPTNTAQPEAKCLPDHVPTYIIFGLQDEVTSWMDNKASVAACGSAGPTMVALVEGAHDPSASVNNLSIIGFVG